MAVTLKSALSNLPQAVPTMPTDQAFLPENFDLDVSSMVTLEDVGNAVSAFFSTCFDCRSRESNIQHEHLVFAAKDEYQEKVKRYLICVTITKFRIGKFLVDAG